MIGRMEYRESTEGVYKALDFKEKLWTIGGDMKQGGYMTVS